MLLSMGEALTKVFTVFAGFWVLVLVVLYLGVGALMKRQERIRRQRHPGSAGPPH
jgi:hypothetical protein